MSASGPNEHIIEAASGPDRRYFSEAVRWENDVIRTVKRSRLTAWLVAVISFALACLALTCLALLLPLKSFEPYVIEVDKTTGFMEIKQPLADGDLTQNEAIARMYVVRYLKARETYDPATVKDNFDLAQLLSARDAARDLFALFSPSNADNPVTRYGRETRVGLKIKSIQLPNALTAVIRFPRSGPDGNRARRNTGFPSSISSIPRRRCPMNGGSKIRWVSRSSTIAAIRKACPGRANPVGSTSHEDICVCLPGLAGWCCIDAPGDGRRRPCGGGTATGRCGCPCQDGGL